jgi:hypothetical protein
VDANWPLRLEDYQGEGCHYETGFDPIEGWISFKKKGRGDHSEGKNEGPKNSLFVVGVHNKECSMDMPGKIGAFEIAGSGTFCDLGTIRQARGAYLEQAISSSS